MSGKAGLEISRQAKEVSPSAFPAPVAQKEPKFAPLFAVLAPLGIHTYRVRGIGIVSEREARSRT